MEVNPAADSRAAQMGWRDFTPLLLLSMPLLYYPSFAYLSERWIQWTEGLSHGYLMMAVFAYLFYRALPFSASRSQSLALTLVSLTGLVAISTLWALLALVNINALAEPLLVGILYLWVASAYGWRTAWSHRFLLLLPLFTFSFWDYLNTPLVNLSAFVVGEWVSWLDIPAVIEGNSIFIPYGHILIADGCSGLRYFIIALAMAYTLSYLNHYKEPGFLLTLAIAAALALLTNWIRIFILILIGYFTEMQSSLMHDHDFFGWALFAAIMLPAMYFAPVQHINQRSKSDARPAHNGLLLALGVALSIGPLIYWLSPSPAAQENGHSLLSAPPSLPSWLRSIEQNTGVAETQPHHIRLGDTWFTTWHYQRVHKGDKLVPYINALHNKQAWHQTDNDTVWLQTNTGQIPAQRQLLTAKGADKQVLQLHWYQVGPWKTHSYMRAKLLQLPATLSGDNRFTLNVLRTECNSDCSGDFEKLATAATLLPPVTE